MTLYDLAFSDLFLCEAISACWFKETPSTRDRRPIPDECLEESASLRSLLLAKGAEDGSKIDWAGEGTSPALRLRIQRMDTVDGPVFVCGRPSVKIATLGELGFPQPIASRLLNEEIRDGLILFMGRKRAGKSTAAAAYTVEHISIHGGAGWTVEAPIELPIHGPHGRGQIYQCEVTNDREFGRTIRKMLRAAADLMLIGEVRDDAAAAEVILAGTTGHLVVTTFHAASLVGGLERFAGMCGSSTNLASALRAAFHLQLRTGGEKQPARSASVAPGKIAPPKRILSVSPLLVPGENADMIRSHIRSGQFQQLASEVERQGRQFMGMG